MASVLWCEESVAIATQGHSFKCQITCWGYQSAAVLRSLVVLVDQLCLPSSSLFLIYYGLCNESMNGSQQCPSPFICVSALMRLCMWHRMTQVSVLLGSWWRLHFSLCDLPSTCLLRRTRRSFLWVYIKSGLSLFALSSLRRCYKDSSLWNIQTTSPEQTVMTLWLSDNWGCVSHFTLTQFRPGTYIHQNWTALSTGVNTQDASLWPHSEVF